MADTDASTPPPFTVGDLMAFIEKHGIPSDCEIFVERDDTHGQFGGTTWHASCPGVTVETTSSGYQSLVVNIDSSR